MAKDSSSSSYSINKSEEFSGGEKDEEFYEEIEAPKFVDFTVPDHYRPDDRYWFCLRVGCDQKHEEEMDSEAIYKNFVLRVMAARSPNVRLHKALNRNSSGKPMKCPLSAPPKSAKSRLPRLAIVSMSQKMDKEKIRHLCKVSSTTPKTKGKQVAAKYLTTPRNKKIPPNPNSFVSVQNPKPSSSSVIATPKNRSVAKALVFNSPKKTINLKTSVETPLTKLCRGMKKLEITSQRKRVLGYSSKPLRQSGQDSQKSLLLHSSTRHKVLNKEKTKSKNGQDTKSSRSGKCKNKGNLSIKDCSLKEIKEAIMKPGDDIQEHLAASKISAEEDSTSTGVSKGESDSSKQSALTSIEGNGLESRKESSENEKDLNDPMKEFGFSEDKENASAFDGNRNIDDRKIQSGKEILGMKNTDKKVEQAVDKNSKGSANIASTRTKLKKSKPTNPKPFRLRTDERGILREAANLDRKFHTVTPQKEAAPSTKFHTGNIQGHHCDIQKGSSRTAAVKTPKKGQARTIITPPPKVLRPLTSTLQSDTCQHLENNDSRHALQHHRMKKKALEAQTPSKNDTKRVVRTKTPSGSTSLSRGRKPITPSQKNQTSICPICQRVV